MTTFVFNDWLQKVDCRMRLQKKKVLLLVDNCAAHQLLPETRLGNVHLHFLPPNTTAHLQPLDAGIIMNFKVQYRLLLMRLLLSKIDEEEGASTFRPDIKLAIEMIVHGWSCVTTSTIANCWRHTKIRLINSEVPDDCNVKVDGIDQLSAVIQQLPIEQKLSVTEYLTMENKEELTCPLTDEDIVRLVTTNEEEDADESIDESPIVKVPTLKEARQAVDSLVLFFEDQGTQPEHLQHALSMKFDLLRTSVATCKQSTLDSFWRK